MHAAEFWFLAAFLAAVAGAAFWFVWNRWHRARLIDDVPTAKIRSAAQGYTELHGRAVFDSERATISPLTATPCLWYRFKIERRSRDSRGRQRWRTVHRGVSDTSFLMEDDTGLCLIDPRGAEVTCAHKRIWQGDREWPLVDRQNLDGRSWLQQVLPGKRYRYTEELLHAGHVYALGLFRTVNAGQSLDKRVRALLQAWKANQTQLVARFDRNDDGQIDVEEWEVARESAQQEALRRQLSQRTALPLHTLSAAEDKPFLITDQSPVRLAQHYRRQAGISVALFMASSLTLFWLFTQRS